MSASTLAAEGVLDLTDPSTWRRLRAKIEVKRAELVEGLVTCLPEGLRHQQGMIEALDWVLAEAKPKPPVEPTTLYPDEDEDD